MRRAIPLLLVALAGCSGTAASQGVEVVDDSSTAVTKDSVTDAGLPMPGESGDAVASSGADKEVSFTPVTAADGRPVLPETVAVIGDSLTLSARAEIESALTDLGLTVVGFDAVESRRMVRGATGIPPGIDAVDEILDTTEPDLWVVALGTNDVGASVSTEMFLDDMVTFLDRLPSSTPVMWVDTFIRQRVDAVEDANAAIRSAIALRPGGHVVDWFVHGEEPGIVTVDGVHLTTRGQTRFAESIAVAIDQSFARS